MFAALAVEIEPMFSVEAKKRMHLAKGQGVKGVADLRQVKAKASDQAADVCGVSPRDRADVFGRG